MSFGKNFVKLIATNNIFSKYSQEKTNFVTTSFVFLLFKSHQNNITNYFYINIL